MLFDYIKRLISKWFVIAYFILDTLTFIFLGHQLPWYTYPLSLIGGLLIGGYLVFSDVKKEADQLRKTLPRITVLFYSPSGISNSAEVRILNPKTEDDIEKEIESALTEARQRLIAKWDNYVNSITQNVLPQVWKPAYPDKKTYESSVTAYLSELRRFLQTQTNLDKNDRALRDFSLVVRNSGNVPAENITIEIVVPEHVTFADQDQVIWYYYDKSRLPDKPEEPNPNASFFEAILGVGKQFANISATMPYIESNVVRPPSNTSGPKYDEEHSCIKYHVSEVIHNLDERNFEPFLLWFGESRGDEDLQLEVKVYCANLPMPITSQLTIHVKMQESHNGN